MKKQIAIELAGDWVLAHRSDDVLPVEFLKEKMLAWGAVTLKSSSLTELVLVFEDAETVPSDVEQAAKSFLAEQYPEDDFTAIVTVACQEFVEEPKQNETSQEGGAVDEILHQIDQLVGAKEFRRLAKEIVQVAPEITEKKTFPVFSGRSYLFSLGDGCGLSTYLELFAKLISAVGLKRMQKNPVYEIKINADKEGMEPFYSAMELLDKADANTGAALVCIDISEWLEKTETSRFKRFLRIVEKNMRYNVVVFRVPFVDKDLLNTLKHSLSDVLSVQTISFPPFGQTEIREYAQRKIENFGYSVNKTAWKFFHERITEEKSDGKFYGLNTIQKVVQELVYNKVLSNTKRKNRSFMITQSDMKALCNQLNNESLSGMEQLNRLIGNEKIKKQVEEILAQIELSMVDQSVDRPCIHMRFVGNPGTGKTTVARIIGKILKEKGVLRIGNFYEYAGRDFCGRYIGETAPKTASICRDAYGSVLFIDEAYSLYRGDDNSRDYGKEAIDTLIAEMENHRNDFVVIMAGYTDDMNTLMKGNQGLASRMPYTIEFPSFSGDELYQIFASLVQTKFKYDEALLPAAKAYFATFPEETLTSKEFSNARFVRNLFERTWAKAAMRCQLNKKNIVLTKDDFERACAEKDFALNVSKKTRLGF